MSKRRIENDISELNDDLLAGLEPIDRLTLVLKGQAEQSEWVSQLIKSCPRYDYRGIDHEFVVLLHLSKIFGYEALLALQKKSARYQYITEIMSLTKQLELAKTGTASPGFPEEFEGMNPITDRFIRLYVQYHALDQFATEELGVSLETWLAFQEDGASVLEEVAEIIDSELDIEFAEEYFKEQLEEVGLEGREEVTLDKLAEQEYARMVDNWKEIVRKQSKLSAN